MVGILTGCGADGGLVVIDLDMGKPGTEVSGRFADVQGGMDVLEALAPHHPVRVGNAASRAATATGGCRVAIDPQAFDAFTKAKAREQKAREAAGTQRSRREPCSPHLRGWSRGLLAYRGMVICCP